MTYQKIESIGMLERLLEEGCHGFVARFGVLSHSLDIGIAGCDKGRYWVMDSCDGSEQLFSAEELAESYISKYIEQGNLFCELR